MTSKDSVNYIKIRKITLNSFYDTSPPPCNNNDTLKRTPDEYVQGQACPAGKLFNDRCDLCHCAANGRSAACTLMLCLSEEVEEVEDTQHRVLSPATEIYSWPHIGNYRTYYAKSEWFSEMSRECITWIFNCVKKGGDWLNWKCE